MPTSLPSDNPKSASAPAKKKKGRRPNMSALAANIKHRGRDAASSSLLKSRAYDPNDVAGFLDEADPVTVPKPPTGYGSPSNTFQPDTLLAARRLGFDLTDPDQSSKFFEVKRRTKLTPSPRSGGGPTSASVDRYQPGMNPMAPDWLAKNPASL